ncbi:MAG TPA: putative lipid II flippase FtsW [Drouetiella sp.]
MSSKILSVQDSKRWRQNSRRATGARRETPAEPTEPEFRGLPNRAILSITLTLCGFGLMAVFSASAPESLQSFHDSTVFLRRQAIACLIGLFMMFSVSRYDYRKLKKWAWPFSLISFCLLALTLVPSLSVTTMGSSRWLQLGPIQFQPSEACKVASIILLASGLSKYFWWHKQIFIRIAVSLVMAGIIMKQPDLGSASMIIGSVFALLFVSGINAWLVTVFVAGGGVYVWHHVQKTPYQMARIQSWLNPYLSPQKDGWNIIQAQLAIGSGGLLGVGFGRSLQKLYYLPVQHADFIFAVISEEFGMVGCLTLLSLFALFGYYGFKTAMDARTLFGRLLAIGITSSICLQAVVNVMVTTGLLPVTGITLPFISYGGTSLVITLTMVGILLSVSRDTGKLSEDDEFGEHEPEPAPQLAT